MWDKRGVKPKNMGPPINQPGLSEPRSLEPNAEVVRIGRSIIIKGEISGSQDLTLEGRLEGKIELKENHVTVSESGIVNGEINARNITIQGQVVGNMYAEERVEIKSTGSLRGDILAPRVVIEDGAYFKGSVDMDAARERSALAHEYQAAAAREQKAEAASILSLVEDEKAKLG